MKQLNAISEAVKKEKLTPEEKAYFAEQSFMERMSKKSDFVIY